MAIYAVLTGDIVDSSQMGPEERGDLLRLLKGVFKEIREKEAGVKQDFDVFRGDSFQGMVSDPSSALRIALYIRLKLLSDEGVDHPNDWDARMAIGIGQVSYHGEEVATSDGPAFRLSGPVLDEMKREERIRINMEGEEEFNWEMRVAHTLLDAASSRWTSKQAQVMVHAMEGKKQGDIARELGISQPAISRMLRISHWEAVEVLMERYEYLVKKYKQDPD